MTVEQCLNNNTQKETIQRARAIIISDGKILLINRVKPTESYWVIPGGRVESGETKEQAVQRECIEELGIEIRVNELFAERISDELEISRHCEFFYLCDVIGGELGTGKGPEYQPGETNYKGEYNIEWVDLNKLPDLNLRPEELKIKIIEKTY